MAAAHRILLDKAITCLRAKIDRKEDPICTITDIMTSMTVDDRAEYKEFTDQSFLNKFFDITKVPSPEQQEGPLRLLQAPVHLQKPVHVPPGPGPEDVL